MIRALETVVPNVEHRFCVMHMYKNFGKNYKGSGLRHLMWDCAGNNNNFMFKRVMKKLCDTNKGAHDERLALHCSITFFRTTLLSNMFRNNHCEVFNSKIGKVGN